MAPPSGVKRPRYGTRRLIEQVFRDSANASGLRTSELVTRVQSASGEGSKIPGPTIFQAARALVRSRVLDAERDGREFRFKLAGKPVTTAMADSTEATSTPTRAEQPRPISGPSEIPKADEVRTAGTLPVSSLPHRLDPGQMLVLKHDEKEIVTLTNVHGRAVIEKHPL